MKIYKVHYTELTPVPSSDYPMLNVGYDHTPYQTEIQAESEEEVYLMFAGNENIEVDLVEPKY